MTQRLILPTLLWRNSVRRGFIMKDDNQKSSFDVQFFKHLSSLSHSLSPLCVACIYTLIYSTVCQYLQVEGGGGRTGGSTKRIVPPKYPYGAMNIITVGN